jgi:hypothetical protein
MGTQNIESDTVEIGTEEGARLIAGSGPQQDKEGFLGEFLGARSIGEAPPEESEEWLFVA